VVAGMRKCKGCGSWISLEEISTHRCAYHVDNIVDKLNYIHCVFQELEGMNISLPMGDYNLMYDIIEDIRDDFEFQKIINLG
jgi:hypothetical protein